MMRFSNKFGLNKALVLFGLLGILFICFSDYVLWYDISAADKINATVLWVTAIAIFWYTKETYDLKILSRKDLEMARETHRNDFLPILAPGNADGVVQGDSFDFKVDNVGKGIARDIEVWMHGITLSKGQTIRADDKNFGLGGNHGNLRIITEQEKPETMDLEILYKDIFGRRFKTTGLVFVRDNIDPGNRYFLDRSNWVWRKISR